MDVDLSYLTVDSVQHGVGASQVLPYVERFGAAGVHTTLHSFEALAPEDEVRRRIDASGARWMPHSFGRSGGAGGAWRVVAGASAIRGAGLVHARSDLAASSALIARPDAWVWDIRSFWIDQRIALGMARRGSPVEKTLRAVERRAASSASAITTLTNAAIPALAERHGSAVADKARVVTTCVDLDRFRSSGFPDGPARLLMSGSFNPLYDMDTMLRFAHAYRELTGKAGLELLRPQPSAWDEQVREAGGAVGASTFADMPRHISGCHAGLSVCRTDHPAALVAAMPTKIGEFLASGRPVVASTGLGDVDDLLTATGAGVVLDGVDDQSIATASNELRDLLADPTTPDRCRAVAERCFSLDGGVATLTELYRSL